jgi:signal transduction histidine kinase
MPVELETIDLNDVVEQTVMTHIPRAEKLGLQLIYKTSRDLSPVRGVRSQLAQVVTNLLVNALNYTKAGYIRVSTDFDSTAGQVCLEIRDSGIGIPSNDLQYIFSRFYRGQNVSQSNFPGSGLGLAIAREIIEQHQGKIEVKSTVGVGSAFQVRLPVGG